MSMRSVIRKRLFLQEWITPDGHDVTEDFIRYARPLIQGNIEVPLGEDELPAFVYRK